MEIVLEIGKYVAAVSGIIGALIIVGKWIKKTFENFKEWLTDLITTVVKEHTKPIQKDSNGGWSLPDLIKLVKKLGEEVAEVKENGHKRMTMLEQMNEQMLDAFTKPTRSRKPKDTTTTE